MKKIIYIALLLTVSLSAQNGSEPERELAFKGGEWLKYRMSYSNFLNAGYSTMEVKEISHDNKAAFHITGFGRSTGLVGLFFKVRDTYQTYMYKESLQPYRFIRKINEGGYTKDKEISFDHDNGEAVVTNHKHNTVESFPIAGNIQDMLSALYFLRNQDFDSIQPGDELELKMFFDEETTNFKLRFLGYETIRTKFGKIASMKFRPIVQAGRVFEEEESVTIWVSADKNKIPLRIKASLAVGSLRADIAARKGLAHPFPIIFDN